MAAEPGDGNRSIEAEQCRQLDEPVDRLRCATLSSSTIDTSGERGLTRAGVSGLQ